MSIVRSPAPRPSRLRPDVPHAIDAIVAKCLAVDPAERFATVADLASALTEVPPHGRAAAERIRRVLERHGARVARPSRGASRTRFGLAAALSLAIGAAAGFSAVSGGAQTQAAALVEVVEVPPESISPPALLPAGGDGADAGVLAVVPQAAPVTVTPPPR
jgi:hypothetical protein